MSPVLYLDIDYVLNTESHPAPTWTPGEDPADVLMREGPGQIAPDLAARVRGIIEATGCRVVVCSAWQGVSRAATLAALEAHGIHAEGGTLDTYQRRFSEYGWRWLAVLAHAASHTEPWVMLDDQGPRGVDRVVRPVDGVTEADAAECVRWLGVAR